MYTTTPPWFIYFGSTVLEERSSNLRLVLLTRIYAMIALQVSGLSTRIYAVIALQVSGLSTQCTFRVAAMNWMHKNLFHTF